VEELKTFCQKKGLEFHAISAATGEGVKDLVRAIADALDKIPKEELGEDDSDAPDVQKPEAVVYEAGEDQDEDLEEGEERSAGQ
jgi:predicted GTPase